MKTTRSLIKILCLMCSLCFVSVSSYAQGLIVPTPMNEFAQDNIRLAQGIKAIKQRNIFRDELADQFAESRQKDSIIKAQAEQIAAKQVRIDILEGQVTTRNNQIGTLTSQLYTKSRYEERGKKLIHIGPSVGYGYAFSTDYKVHRAAFIGIAATVSLIRPY